MMCDPDQRSREDDGEREVGTDRQRVDPPSTRLPREDPDHPICTAGVPVPDARPDALADREPSS